MKRIARNKHPTKQKIDKRFVQNLKKYNTELEDCVQSQQKTIEELRSEIANNALAYQIKDKRYNDMLKYCELNRPEILQLMKTFAKQGVLAAQGKVKPIEVVLMKAKRKAPKIPEAPPQEWIVVDERGKPLGKTKMQFKDEKEPLPPLEAFEKKHTTEDIGQIARDVSKILVRKAEKAAEDLKPAPRLPNVSAPIETARAEPVEVWNPKTRKFEKEKPQ